MVRDVGNHSQQQFRILLSDAYMYACVYKYLYIYIYVYMNYIQQIKHIDVCN